jgi:hypothetical protein
VTIISLASRLSTTPRPKPRLAPTTSAVRPVKFIVPPKRVLTTSLRPSPTIGSNFAGP